MGFPFSWWNTAPTGRNLPEVGPFATNGTVAADSLPSINFTIGGECSYTQNRATPLTYRDIVFSNSISPLAPDHGTTASVYMWADIIKGVVGPVNVLADGGGAFDGSDENVTGDGAGGGGGGGGSGGAAGSGGGVGGQGTDALPSDGSNGGSGVNGDPAPQTYWPPNGNPGAGLGAADSAGYGDYGVGGDGGVGGTVAGTAGLGGAGDNGFGGGGGGADATGQGNGIGAGGGGAGAGSVNMVANEFAGSMHITAIGGAGGASVAGGVSSGGGGGGGSIRCSFRKYNGGITVDVSGGPAGPASGRSASSSFCDLIQTDAGWPMLLTSLATGYATNLITFSASTAPLSYTEVGNAIAITYQDSNLLSDIVNLINANSTLISAVLTDSDFNPAEGSFGPETFRGGLTALSASPGADGAPGTARIFRINVNDTETEMLFTDTWDLL